MKPYSTNRNRAYYRHQRNRVIQRKRKLAKQIGWYTRYPGYFANGKIHCSCSMCSKKTKKDGFPHSQKMQLERMKSQIYDYFIKKEF